MTDYEVSGGAYSMAERYDHITDSDWYEYEVRLVDSEGEVVDAWDSYLETYPNGNDQRLDREDAEAAFAEVADDVAEGEADAWFSLDHAAA